MEVTGRKTQWEGSFLRMVLLEYRDRQGRTRHWEVAERTNTDGVVIMAALTPDRRLVLIRQFRPALESYIIELPAGLIDKGESPDEACRRELIEETGLAPESIQTLTDGVISTGVLTENWHAMLATGAKPATKEELKAFPPDETEDIEVIHVHLDRAFDELSEMEKRGERIDIRIYGIIELARRKLDKAEA